MFRKYGEIQSSYISHDRVKKESRGYGYVTFLKSSDAARALEECNPCFNARFAFTNLQQQHTITVSNENQHSLDLDQRITYPNVHQHPLTNNFDHLINNQFREKENNNISGFHNVNINNRDHDQLEKISKDTRCVRLIKTCDSEIQSPFLDANEKINSDFVLRIKSKLNENFVRNMFNIVPGLRIFKTLNCAGEFVAKYTNDLVTYYAMQKLNNFELPSGEVTFMIEYIKESELNSLQTSANGNLQPIFVYITFENVMTDDLLELIMNQFKNLNSCKMLNGNKSGFALFSNQLDAKLAVNTLDNRHIANNFFQARIETNFEDILFKTSLINLN